MFTVSCCAGRCRLRRHRSLSVPERSEERRPTEYDEGDRGTQQSRWLWRVLWYCRCYCCWHTAVFRLQVRFGEDNGTEKHMYYCKKEKAKKKCIELYVFFLLNLFIFLEKNYPSNALNILYSGVFCCF